jgi:methyl-accepting chemotaxis protein
MLNNLKIGPRLLVGFGAIIVILGLGSLTVLWNVSVYRAAADDSDVTYRSAVLASDLSDNIHVTSGTVALMLSDNRPGAREEHQRLIDKTRADRTRIVSDLKPLLLSEQDRRSFAEIEEATAAARSVNDQVLRLIGAPKIKEAAELFATKADALNDRRSELVSRFKDLQDAEVKETRVRQAAIYRRMLALVFATGAVCIGLAGLFSFTTSRSISKPLHKAVAVLDVVAKGDLSRRVDADLAARGDEIGDLARAVETMAGNLRSVLGNVQTSAVQLTDSSHILSTAATEVSSQAAAAADRAATVSTAAGNMSRESQAVASGIEQSAANLASVATATEEMSATVADIAGNSEKARLISANATRQADELTRLIKELGTAAREVGQVTETINAISAQTNLLALNATIEAARAGTAGKGFAVVANEVKELAQQTATATEDIKRRIAAIQDSTKAAVDDIDKIGIVIRNVGDIVATIATAIDEQAASTKDIASNIAEASAGIRHATGQVTGANDTVRGMAGDIASVTTATSAITAVSQKVESSAASLSALATELRQQVSQFRL